MHKVVRKIISIDEDKCDGCGLCIPSCAEGALQIVDGKARLVKDIYCDGLGNCLGECPRDAITMIEREAEPFDEIAVEEHLGNLSIAEEETTDCGACCGSTMIRDIALPVDNNIPYQDKGEYTATPEAELRHWPVQLNLVSPQSRFLQGVDLLISADCVPFAYADFHRSFLAGRSLLIGCPKLDDVEAYQEKLAGIFKTNNLKSITIVLMEVGCCFGLSRLVHAALEKAEVNIPVKEIVINIDGTIKSEQEF